MLYVKNGAAFARIYRHCCNKMFLTLLLFMFLTTLLKCNAADAGTQTKLHEMKQRECYSMDIRNDCKNILELAGCTVIKGFLTVSLLSNYTPDGRENCSFDNFTFPLLREVTDFVVFYDVKGLTSIKKLFPNLTVIRGRYLFLNYALGISNMPHLQSVEFKSLIEIQRGHVYIGSSPNLCGYEMVNWDRLTTSIGDNHVNPNTVAKCPPTPTCKDCKSNHCWSNEVCQKFDNDNLMDAGRDVQHCHKECLGGCINDTNAGCAVCRHLTDHGVCVNQCPPDKYLRERFQRCYTYEECSSKFRLYKHANTCLAVCPDGYVPDRKYSICKPCKPHQDCTNICNPHRGYAVDFISHLADIDRMRNCRVINSTLLIAIRNQINESELVRSFANLREIRGYLKIYNSPHLKSLKFLQNLEKITGDPLENNVYSLVIYNNQQLKELWDPKNLVLENGGVYMHLNNKLCNEAVYNFASQLKHNQSLNSMQNNDEEVFCGIAEIALTVEKIKERHELALHWSKAQTFPVVEIIYRAVPHGANTFDDKTELDSNVCSRIGWERILLYQSALSVNDTHYTYVIRMLEPNTRYGCMVRASGDWGGSKKRSELVFATTDEDVPLPPLVEIVKKTDDSLTIQWSQQLADGNQRSDVITYYRLDVYELPDNVAYIDQRDFCAIPPFRYSDIADAGYMIFSDNEDYDDCCARMQEYGDDDRFMQNMRKEYGCALGTWEYCINETHINSKLLLLSKHYLSNESAVTVHRLKNYHLYVLQVSACNNIGCSSYSAINTRTNYTVGAELLKNLLACRMPDTMDYKVYFREPKRPNGPILNYIISFQEHQTKGDNDPSEHRCVTRLQHAQANYLYTVQLNNTFEWVRVRVNSFSGDTKTDWVQLSDCEDFAKRMADDIRKAQSHDLLLLCIFILCSIISGSFWCVYKRRRHLRNLRRHRLLRGAADTLRTFSHAPDSMEDRQILVDNYESVRFRNLPEERGAFI